MPDIGQPQPSKGNNPAVVSGGYTAPATDSFPPGVAQDAKAGMLGLSPAPNGAMVSSGGVSIANAGQNQALTTPVGSNPLAVPPIPLPGYKP